MPTTDTLAYSASCNPPRKAKRPRTDAEIAASSAQAALSQQRSRPHILPKDIHPSSAERESSDAEDDEEDEYDPVSPAPAPPMKRRGRKPGPLSRSARESQRKLNHSRIEKARRTKINETLATLSNFVADAEKQRGGKSIAAPEENTKKGDKEFKLDVLVKTVTYIEELIHKVKTLENRSCARCPTPNAPTPVSPPESPTRKRKASDFDVDVDVIPVADDEVDPPPSPLSPLPPPPRPVRSSPSVRAQSKAPSQSPCLPPISSWLPNPYVDPSCLSALPSPSPNGPPSHLPTPPLSGSFRVPLSLAASAPPALALPGPAHPMPSPTISAETNRMHIRMPRRRMSAHAPSVSPTVSPSWTPEDETAASLLLSMSSSPSASSTSSRLRGNSLESNGSGHPKVDWSMTPMHAETPSSLLGLGRRV
ncbi:uncharacterized protein PHACADRAFT_194268 [Phanerochaete carnosa HHB-10118-sp]|uniref:BHLH domain-containing protein n=1 Tax=Phanerochaete carnosa (strain HHB-10118-sp) TaxID=650164 RepID=K5V2C8_PHACS|nr:uncharacterized protein PHACADRAFT_194268 [Phanerochaete carnosa HHB-10118-sp]EKM56681.1 hypothetical protein PHACADRAFT_194268 [Phanerochaete carnosa HHB-10118-sp]